MAGELERLIEAAPVLAYEVQLYRNDRICAFEHRAAGRNHSFSQRLRK